MTRLPQGLRARGLAQVRIPAATGLLLLLLALAVSGCVHAPNGPGMLPVARANLVLPRGPGGRELPVRVVWPVQGGPHPVVLFSHGGGSSRDMYDRLANHWAAAGYVVILPTHRDSRRLGFDIQAAPRELMVEILDSRRQDLVFLADSLVDLPGRLPALAGRIDPERIAVGGHSLGGATALTVTGLVLEDLASGARFGFREPRFDALILLTEPANSPMMAEDPWRAVPVPVLVATGSRDYSGQWGGPPKRRFFGIPADHPRPTGVPRHYLFIDEMDHYLGGLVCRTDVPGPRDLPALAAVQEASTHFLHAYLREDGTSQAALDGDIELAAAPGRRATLSRR